jgi:hypothetical protein
VENERERERERELQSATMRPHGEIVGGSSGNPRIMSVGGCVGKVKQKSK